MYDSLKFTVDATRCFYVLCNVGQHSCETESLRIAPQVPVKYNEKTDEVIRVDVITPGGGNGGNVDSDATAGESQGSNS